MKRGILATLAGTVVLMIWGMVFWGVISPATGMFKAIPSEPAVTKALGDLPTGTYFVPWPFDTPETMKAFRDRHLAGSFYQLSLVREGVDPQSGRTLLLGLLHHAIAVVVAVLLLAVARPPTFGRRFFVVLLGGTMATVFATLDSPVWFHLPWPHALGRAGYELVAWALLGLTLGRMLTFGGRRR